MADKIPRFVDLPLREGDPPLSAWGLYGEDDELGTLNRLTPSLVTEAAREIKTGVRISLDWPLSAQVNPFFGRQPFHHEIYTKHPRCVNDDVWTFNTQSSSQWDGLRHFAYQDERVFYGGRGLLEFGLEEAAASDSRSSVAKRNVGSSVLGISAMAQKGIVGRGVLVDWEGWRAANEPGYEPEVFGSRTRLGLDELKRVLEWQGTQVRFGDLLFVRSGYLRTFKTTSQHTIDPLTKASPPSFIGVAQNEEMACWLWENFSAVAGDMPAFEAFPPQQISAANPKILHEVLLGGWGMPIGELFDLDALATHCKQVERWEFFVSSKVCDVPGGVASPPNAIAIF